VFELLERFLTLVVVFGAFEELSEELLFGLVFDG
jgi:hypothetical protein